MYLNVGYYKKRYKTISAYFCLHCISNLHKSLLKIKEEIHLPRTKREENKLQVSENKAL